MRAAGIWQQDQSQSIKLYQWLKEYGCVHLVHYEKLITETQSVLADLCGFLGISYSEKMEEYQENGSTIKNANQTAVWKNIGKPVMTKNYNKYKKGLSIKEIQFVEAVCDKEMSLLGYEKDFNTEIQLEALRHALEPLELYNKPGYELSLIHI